MRLYRVYFSPWNYYVVRGNNVQQAIRNGRHAHRCFHKCRRNVQPHRVTRYIAKLGDYVPVKNWK